ncbi:MAG: DUF1285 domain-containing protein [Notoacmeibacter sp.]|nr:DUF1285 domain-containing protein [Notoacmeibacter sp.]MCC0033376.1 DUF1285 domain-containing protein [Brucellaceae bacterium]
MNEQKNRTGGGPDSGLSGQRDTAGLEALIARAAKGGRGPAPVDRWEPAYCGELDMEIRRDGTWFYMGTPIGREALVRLFATVLRKDADGFTYLVTPVEKVRIRVEDAPFVAVEVVASDASGQQALTFRTNVGDVVEAGPDHPLRFEDEDGTGGMKPYLHVRGRLEALVNRAMMYELVKLGEEADVDGVSMFVLRSHGMVFPVMRMDRLERLMQ